MFELLIPKEQFQESEMPIGTTYRPVDNNYACTFPSCEIPDLDSEIIQFTCNCRYACKCEEISHG